MTEYRFSFYGAGCEFMEVRVSGPDGSFGLEAWIPTRYSVEYWRPLHNGTDEEWQADMHGRLGLLYRRPSSNLPLSPALVSAFNAWRKREHAHLLARIVGDPERYGRIEPGDSILTAPDHLCGGVYVTGRGWIKTCDGFGDPVEAPAIAA